MGRYQELINKLADCQGENIDLVSQNEYLKSRVVILQRENAMLRRQLREASRDTQILKRALDAAQYMTIMHVAGRPISLLECMSDGMPRSDWYWGRALLIDSRVHNGKRITNDNVEEINACISRSVSRYTAQGFWSLKARNPNRLWRGTKHDA